MWSLLIALTLVASGIAIRWSERRRLAREARLRALVNPPYVSPGGPLPDFFHGHDWPVNPNRRSSR